MEELLFTVYPLYKNGNLFSLISIIYCNSNYLFHFNITTAAHESKNITTENESQKISDEEEKENRVETGRNLKEKENGGDKGKMNVFVIIMYKITAYFD